MTSAARSFPSSSPSSTRRRACRAFRPALSRARRARRAATRSSSSTTAAATVRRRCCASSRERRPDVTRVVLFNANYGQHMAIIAGFERCRGERVVTLDADLQNPPEEIAQAARRDGRGPRLRRRRPPHARGLVVAPRRVARDEPAARTDHPHPDDRPGLHAARLQPRHRRRHRREPRGEHVHPRAGLHVRRATRPKSTSRTRSAPPASRSIRCTG